MRHKTIWMSLPMRLELNRVGLLVELANHYTTQAAHMNANKTESMCLKQEGAMSIYGRCPRGLMVKAVDCGIVVSEFVLQSRYYVHFRANTLGKGMNSLILPAVG